MINKLIILFSFCLALAACSKTTAGYKCTLVESTVVAPAAEVANLQAYITANRPAALQHPSGFFYEIMVNGTGTVTPAVCSTVNVKYAGYLTSGYKFDERTTGVNFVLGDVIIGWQKGLPLIKKGGSINLYLPPSLGYGSAGTATIPPNSILIFSIQLQDVL